MLQAVIYIKFPVVSLARLMTRLVFGYCKLFYSLTHFPQLILYIRCSWQNKKRNSHPHLISYCKTDSTQCTSNKRYTHCIKHPFQCHTLVYTTCLFHMFHSRNRIAKVSRCNYLVWCLLWCLFLFNIGRRFVMFLIQLARSSLRSNATCVPMFNHV